MCCGDVTLKVIYSSSGLVWSCTETVILTFNRLESTKVHYMDTNAGMFSSKTFIYFYKHQKSEIVKPCFWARLLRSGKRWIVENILAALGFEPTPSKWLEPKSCALDQLEKTENILAAVGFEPTPSQWLEPKSSALDQRFSIPVLAPHRSTYFSCLS